MEASDSEIMRAAEVILKSRRKNCLVILNVVAQSTILAKAQAKLFDSLGCDALMCLPPSVLPMSQRQLIDHLRAVMETSSLPHILQHAAGLTAPGTIPQIWPSCESNSPTSAASKSTSSLAGLN